MAKGSLNVKINLDYLELIKTKSGLKQKDFWESLGHTKSMQWNVDTSGKMHPSLALLICKMYGAEYDRLVITEKPPKPELPAPVVDSKAIAHMAATIERVERKQNEIDVALLILKERQDEIYKVLQQLL